MSAPAVGVVAGSGLELRPLLDTIHEELHFHDVPGLADGTVLGHQSVFLRGECAGRPVVLQCGRLHPYEGMGYAVAMRTVDTMHAWGVRDVVFTNAVGGLGAGFAPGYLVAADEVLAWPFRPYGLPERIAPDFEVAGCDATGRYAWMHGPCYETRAEIAGLRNLGAATVGMSCAAELHRAQALGMRGAIVSCVTNICGAPGKLTHDHVLETARGASERLVELLRGLQ